MNDNSSVIFLHSHKCVKYAWNAQPHKGPGGGGDSLPLSEGRAGGGDSLPLSEGRAGGDSLPLSVLSHSQILALAITDSYFGGKLSS